MSSTSASTEGDYVYQEVNRLSVHDNEGKLTGVEVSKLFKYFTKNSNEIAEIEKSLKRSPNDEIRLMYLKELLTEQPVVTASSPDNSVYVFIDNSNLFIEGSKIVSRFEKVNVCDNKKPNFLDFYIDHGQLVTTALHGRKMGSAFVIGSVPPPNDTLWNRAKSHGCEVKTYQRNASNKEKKVDTKLVCRAMRSILTKNPSTLLLIAGDSDYCPLVEEAKEENWKIETWFWDGSYLPSFSTGMSSELRSISLFEPLDSCYRSFAYITGPDSTNNYKYTLEIEGNIIKNWLYRNETLMACFCELGLLGRWHWTSDTSALLYFEKQRHLDNAELYLKRNYQNMWVQVVKKVVARRNSFKIQRGGWR